MLCRDDPCQRTSRVAPGEQFPRLVETPAEIEGMLDASGTKMEIVSEHMTGLDLYLDPAMIDARTSERVAGVLRQALDTLERNKPAK